MKVALVVPPISLKERYNKALANVTGSLPPLGLLSIGTVLKNAGHDICILDGSVRELDDIMAEIDRFRPDIVGITSMTLMWPKVKLLSKKVKEKWPDLNIVVGGVHTTLIREKALSEIPDIDAICWGEGEFSMLEYVEKFNNLHLGEPIDGFAFRLKDGNFVVGRDREPIKDINILPIPDRTLLPVKKYVPAIEQYKTLPVTNMFTTRGCPFKCIFCLPNLLGKGVRFRSVDNVMEEIDILVTGFGIKEIAFWDNTFTVNKKRVFDICKRKIESKLNFIWSAQARADCVTPDMLKIMANAGCWKVFFGVESLVQKNLDTINKGETVEQIFEAVGWAKKAGIEVEASFIFGIPGRPSRKGWRPYVLQKSWIRTTQSFFIFPRMASCFRK